ncbi:bifunctional diaminohydroxyphosphoribosylaminopyrimidine deaminase/5-amino-6-(5-phosphoribosylamino)uracil reductase RibD [Acidithiobacillus sp. AMEEHan]|uniref:bifunctional diaminohydroxyphosphoribosylaminopyrimidine deaminase/5-amino-6-(5-phosphoribosylamino)uracil reductase RibD n=1 Tax=Acidithiobacillus sp. AMEEHan TaxID=2994951 RepID=UPI0027E5B964|nr:bifunctional diaminohydroxyphosphoribosylaminopyrimidine deaminase/5-amino-6-(5-phosphoribosylamino)uracil reductase RibD [Acidithiobacillus sp. AMEEHan]
MPIDQSDIQHMRQALALARQGLYSTHPNPRVGAILVRDGREIGRGAHRLAGGPHAEVLALREAGDAARGATLYVTLEPCSHHGRTPPCSDALITAGVRRVVVGMVDPNPLVAGQGIARLRAAGIEVDVPCLEEEAAWLNRGFLQRMRAGRPWIRIKQASSLDGKIALANGQSQWLTGVLAREDVQQERAQASAILVGVGTVLADDPRLAPRLATELPRYPVKIVLDGRLRTPPTAAMLRSPGAIWIVHRDDIGADKGSALVAAGVRLVALPAASSGVGVDFAALMAFLAAEEINELLVEAGGRLASSLLRAGLVDEYLLYFAPLLLGQDARAFAEIGPYHELARVPRWRLRESRSLGEDMKVRYLCQQED